VIETKVKASSGAAFAAGIADWLLGKYVLHGADPAVAAEIYAAVPAVLAFAAGWLAPHTSRTPPPGMVKMAGPVSPADAAKVREALAKAVVMDRPVTRGTATATTAPPVTYSAGGTAPDVTLKEPTYPPPPADPPQAAP
jgi:hypothetical protein